MPQYESYIGENLVNIFLLHPNEKNMRKLINYSRLNELKDTEILSLANGLSDSGEKISLKNGSKICDIPSTGGPTSLSTLICPLFLVNLGNKVLKLSVPGRPAGGIDVLAQIKGYNIAPNTNQLNSWIQSNGYVHFLANNNFAPLDALLFKFRKENNAIDIPSLVIASLLSKKIAVGLTHVGLDIRVSTFGNFGRTWEQARRNGYRFNKIANLAGIKSKCFLNNGNIPQQPYIGRGEVILAMHRIFCRKAEDFLQKHVELCFRMASSISENKVESFSYEALREIFFENIEMQGGSIDSFDEIAFNTENSQGYFIEALQNGFININLEYIRNAIVAVQKECNGEYPDPCGIILKVTSNEYVNKGDVICTFRCLNKHIKTFEEILKMSFRFLEHVIPPMEFEEII